MVKVTQQTIKVSRIDLESDGGDAGSFIEILERVIDGIKNQKSPFGIEGMEVWRDTPTGNFIVSLFLRRIEL